MENTRLQEPKLCPRCQETKEPTEFGKNVRLHDGLDFYCRTCVREISRERRKHYRETVEPRTIGTKKCTKCKQMLEVSNFRIDRGRSDGLQSACNLCYREWQSERTRRNKETYQPATDNKRCCQCKQVLPPSAFAIARDLKEGLSPHCKRCDAKAHQRLRVEVLGHYAGGTPACACCQETIVEFLSIDHVNGGGTEQRRTGMKGSIFYRWLKKEGYPRGYQVLCHNCNQAKGFYGECPHQRQRAAE